MSLLSTGTLGSKFFGSTPWKPWDDFWYNEVAGIGSTVGINVTQGVALQVAAVFACVKVISETLATWPLITYRRLPNGGKDRAPDAPLYTLLHDSPNAWQTAIEFIDDMTGHAVLHEGAFAEIIPGLSGAVEELAPLRPEWVKVEKLPTRRLRYTVTEPGVDQRVLTQDQVLHIRPRSVDFVNGLSVQRQARDAIALARAIETYGAKFFQNDASGGVMIEHPGKLTKEAMAMLRESWNANYAGKPHQAQVLQEGMKANRLATTHAKDAQLTEAQEQAVLPICRFFRMPPHKIQHLLNATFSNIEHQGIEFVTDTMMPWARRWEQRINASLITDPTLFVEFLNIAHLRGDAAARGAYYTARFNIGTISQNEIRRAENENPIEGGDRYFVQGALVPTDMVDKVIAARQTAPKLPDSSGTGARALIPVKTFDALIDDAASRIASAEVREIDKRANLRADPARFAMWLASFYQTHGLYVARTIDPLLITWRAASGRRTADTIVEDILAGAYRPSLDFASWQASRAADIRAALLEELQRDAA